MTRAVVGNSEPLAAARHPTSERVSLSAVTVTNKQQTLQAALRNLADEPGVVGALLVSRDGIRVLEVWKRDMWNKETLSAMSATLMGAAEVALSEGLGADRGGRVVAEIGKKRMAILGPTHEMLLVVIADAQVSFDRLLGLAEAASLVVHRTLSGA
ncbi:MAG TPA: roadblock/LC7 domain-containing protein [Candidatus Thermoplasmatota archaeon]|jgi:predicted regulator of Ras-like GTPase activity (Roadblock/LC7/MglB family)|nr:roadblock/LC7 domain-containing protein [Candidatus Thermoplasmatota archaeon]